MASKIKPRGEEDEEETRTESSIELAGTIVSVAHTVIIMVYILFSFLLVSNKPIFATDTLIVSVVSAMMHFVKGSKGDHTGVGFFVSLIFTVPVIVTLCYHLSRVFTRTDQLKFNSYSLVPVGFQMTRQSTIIPPFTYNEYWLNSRMAVLIISLAFELFSLSLSLCVFYRSPDQPHLLDHQEEKKKKRRYWCCFYKVKFHPCSGFWSFACVSKKSEQWFVIGLKFVVGHSLLFTLTGRILLSFASLHYDLPYWTEQETPSAFFYCAVFILFEILLTTQDSKRNSMSVFLCFVLMLTALVISSACLILDMALVDTRHVGFLNLDQYISALTNGVDMGGWKYIMEVPSRQAEIQAVFGKMTFFSHCISIIEILEMGFLNVLLLLWLGSRCGK